MPQGSSGEDQKPRGAHWRRTRASKARVHSEDLPHPDLELRWRLSWEVGVPYGKTFEGSEVFLVVPNWSVFTQLRAAVNTDTELNVMISIMAHFCELKRLDVWTNRLPASQKNAPHCIGQCFGLLHFLVTFVLGFHMQYHTKVQNSNTLHLHPSANLLVLGLVTAVHNCAA